MSERAAWTSIRPVLKAFDPVRIESPMESGVPDVNLTVGWMELKYAARWPPKGGPLRLDHYTQEQKTWATRRIAAGGRVFLLLKVGREEWLLFDGRIAAIFLGKSTREELYKVCLARWTRLPKNEEMSKCLQGQS